MSAATDVLESAHPSRAAAPGAVVVVGPLPPPSGGMANQTRQLVGLLAGEGCRVHLVQTNAPYVPAIVGRIRGLRAFFRLVPYLARLWRAVAGADVVHVMANSGWAWHLSAAPAVWAAWWRKVPVVVNYRGGEADRFLAAQLRWIRPTLARTAVVAVPSGFLESVFSKYGYASVIVPNVVNLDAFRPAREPPQHPHLVVTRNLEPIYDIGTAIRAFALVAQAHPDARLTIAGSGPERASLERVAAELGVRDAVRFTGRLDNAALPDLYRTATAMLNPSLVDNMPNSVLEAMASGVPVISTDVGGVPYIVAHEVTALLVPAQDPHAMAGAVLRLIGDRELARRLAGAAAAEVRRYTWPKVRGELFGAYALARSRGRSAPCS